MKSAIEQLRAEIDAAKIIARAKFAADWGGLTPQQACEVAVANAHLFKPVGG